MGRSQRGQLLQLTQTLNWELESTCRRPTAPTDAQERQDKSCKAEGCTAAGGTDRQVSWDAMAAFMFDGGAQGYISSTCAPLRAPVGVARWSITRPSQVIAVWACAPEHELVGLGAAQSDF